MSLDNPALHFPSTLGEVKKRRNGTTDALHMAVSSSTYRKGGRNGDLECSESLDSTKDARAQQINVRVVVAILKTLQTILE